ncbi:toxin-antitoxin system YwqK family antitoxin [Desulfovibrio litoralis]|uniref:MORN repeat variant n=1 Tax=Desulfovibrio litoralis DSM 11393 TaxID=1121455 RepID=A0A1M7SFN2_9BACT|nr:hypothetical protein [Desulfovibrio litoralis]SHN57279.1 MORN repeat variant [Desulfovibrio litoralis DSM 11393]
MKNFIVIVTLCLFCLLSIHTPNAFSQESCPKTLEEVKKDKKYKLVTENLYEFKQADFSLRCFYGKTEKLEAEIPFVADKIEGIWKAYYESGKINSETPYVAGKREGVAKGYYENGKLEFEIVLANSSPVSGICYKTNGETRALTDQELADFRNGKMPKCD